MKKTLVFLLSIFTLLSWSQAFAEVPTSMQFQGYLTDADGEPLRGSHEISFTLYGSADGFDSVWTQTQQVEIITESFTAILGGSENPLDAGVFSGGQSLWLGVKIGNGEELFPRSSISAVPYATRATVADNTTGDITPKSISVDGSTVINENGQWVGDPTGLQGIQGEQGIKGDTGDTGLTGATGSQGEKGIKGDTGDQGIQGIMGDTGDTGDQGLPGTDGFDGIHCWDLDKNGVCSCTDNGNGLCEVNSSDEDINDNGVCDVLDCTGSQGEQGIKGDTGDQGSQGEQGIKGNTGDQGIQGEQGITGDTGDQGEQGIKGDTGLTGTTGSQGEKGDTGNKGFSGSDGLDCWDLDGNSFCSCTIIGELCEVHPSDEDINDDGVCDVLDCTGPQGDQGVQGEQGIKGDIGDQGIQGEQGIKGDTGDTGLTGATGSQGEKGIKGDTGDQGTQGEQGIQGDQGIKGNTGDTGVVGSDGIHCWDMDGDGSCTCTAIGGYCKVNSSDEDINDDGVCDVLDCIGSQGEQGIKGDTGDQGSQGEQGIKGDTGDQGSAGTDGADGSDGIHCWDLNEDASCDLVTEDTNSSGDCDVDDCYSSAYTDLSNDGRLDYDDDDLVTKSQADSNYAPAETETELDAALARIDTLETLLDGINAVSDACALGWDNCDENATCTDTDIGFTCECNEGYKGDGVTCDIYSYVWTDPDTSYMWQKSDAGTDKTRSGAETYCDNLTLEGHDDWHLPTISELRSLIDGCTATETGGNCGVTDSCLSYTACKNSVCIGCTTNAGPDDGCYWPTDIEGTCNTYWSSSDEPTIGERGAWYIYFAKAKVSFDTKDVAKYVRCVR